MSPREIKVLLPTCLKHSFALSLNNERASIFPTRTVKSLLLPVRSLIVLWMKVRGLSPGTRHPSIFPEFAIRDSFRRHLARRLLPAFRHGPASTFDKSPRKDF